MRKLKEIQGFNPKEQKIYEMLADSEPHSFAEMKKLFAHEAKNYCPAVYNTGWGDHEVDVVSQSMARNAVRRLIRDGWAEQCARGTYRLTRTGKSRLDRGIDKTPSFGTKRGRPASTDKKKKKKAKVTAKPKKKAAAKKMAKKAAPKKQAKSEAKSKKKTTKAKTKAASQKGQMGSGKAKGQKGSNGVKAKAAAAVKRAKKVAVQEKAAAAAERAKKAAKSEVETASN